MLTFLPQNAYSASVERTKVVTMPSEALTDLTRADLFHKIDGAIAEFKNIEKRLDKRMNKIDDAHKGDHDILVGLQVSLEGIIEILKRHDAKLDNLNDVNAKLAQHGLHEGTQDGNRLWMGFRAHNA